MNPLLITLNEALANNEPPAAALVLMMMAAMMSKDPGSILLAASWETENGEPTYEKLRNWAKRFAADPYNEPHMFLLTVRHQLMMKELTPAQRAHVERFIE
jgi:hypothetical protein